MLAEAKALGYLEATCTINNVFPYPVEDERTVALRSGKTVTMRPAMVYDAGNIKSLFYELPEGDRYTRFFRQIKSLSSDDVEKLCNVDYQLAVAFVAVDGSRETNHVVGHASYFINPSTNMGETAFMVAPSWQGTGLGSALQKCLVEHAKSRGIRGFQAEILPQNQSMIRLARSCCENVSIQRDEDAVHVTMIF